ncbi:MAG: cbb3-type cytochrome oxidase assembly protein CcoS [Deltaproteobacteria bacterium]
MTIPFAAYLLLLILFAGAAVAMAAFIWAVRKGQFRNLNAAAFVIFDEEEPTGLMTDEVFKNSESKDIGHKSN